MSAAALFSPEGQPWVPIPRALPRDRPSREVFSAIIAAGGRSIDNWTSTPDLERKVQALWSGDHPVTISLSDRQLAERIGRSTRYVQQGLLRLEHAGWISRSRAATRRTIRLTRPAAAGGEP
jgi:hypothetical protein